jgi:hypothetical protein
MRDVARPIVAAALALSLALTTGACAGTATAPTEDPLASLGPIPTLIPKGNDGPVPASLAPSGTGAATAEPGTSGAPSAAPASPEAGDDEGSIEALLTPELGTVLFGPFRRAGYPLPEAVEAAAEETCRARPVPVHMDEIGSRRVVVSDMRGRGVILLVFADASGASACRVEVGRDAVMRATHFRVDDDPSVPLEEGALTLGAMEYQQDGTFQRAVAIGRVGDGARFVRAGFTDDTYVTATIRDGWYAMWWPGQERALVVVASDNRNVAMGKVTPP